MFRSRRRSLVIPQAEHARLSGALAAVWGNKQFPKPALDFISFVTGVLFHDRGYPARDTDEIGDVDEHRWLALQKQSAEQSFDDRSADLVVQFHVRRLLGYRPTPEREAYRRELDRLIEASLLAGGFSRCAFEEADRITHFCDNVSFDFCFEEPRSGSLGLSSQSSGTAEVRYSVDGKGGITIGPWPLSVERLDGCIVGYRLDGYPDEAQPVAVPYSVRPDRQPD